MRHNRSFSHFIDIGDPLVFYLRLGSNALQALLAQIADAIGNPFDDGLGADRVVAKRGVDGNEEVRKAGGLHPQVVARSIGPLVLDRLSVFAANIDPGQRSGYGIKARGIDDDIEFILPLSGLDPFGGDGLDWSLAHVNQQDVVPVIRLVIVGFQRNAFGAEGMVLGCELFRDDGVLDSGTNLIADEFGEVLIGFRVRHDVVKIAQPLGEAGLCP